MDRETRMKATQQMYRAAEMAVRAKIEAYSSFDSAMIPDDLLNQMVTAGVDAAMQVAPNPIPAPQPGPSPIPEA